MNFRTSARRRRWASGSWRGRSRALLFVLLALGCVRAIADDSCAICMTWNEPVDPFQIFGNTYYVGARGLSSILITSPQGHVLIDGGFPESAALIATNKIGRASCRESVCPYV